jgi:diacylglycerol kinase
VSNFLIMSIMVMIVSNLCSIEVLCDFVEPQQNEHIRVVKDIAAAAVGLIILVWAAILVIESIHLFQIG